MSRKLDNDTWEEYIYKFASYKGTITVKDFCIDNNLSKTQFYYHKKRLEKKESKTVFHAISLNSNQDKIEKNISISKEVKINIGKASIAIPVSETSLISSIIKDLVTEC